MQLNIIGKLKANKEYLKYCTQILNVNRLFILLLYSEVDFRGLMLWLFVRPTGVYLLDFFCSGIQFYLLLSPYLCFISLLYLDLYVLGDDALIN